MLDIFEGKTDLDNLPVDLYLEIAKHLEGGLLKGAGGSLASFDGKDLDLIQELRANVYMFSAAKTYEEVRGFSELLYNDEDKIRPFGEFFADAKARYDTYNIDYARTEYNTAIASGEMGIRWNQITKDADTLPLLKMTVVEDAQTTEICEPLDGITLPIGDPFWDEYYPPNHWNCRSTVLQLDEGEVSTKAQVEKAVEHADEEMQDVFKMNVGKDEFVFSPEHPYFTNAPREARDENFGLPMPPDLEPEKLKRSIEDRIREIKEKIPEITDERKVALVNHKIDKEIATKGVKDAYQAYVDAKTPSAVEEAKAAYLAAKAELDAVVAQLGPIQNNYAKKITDLLESDNGISNYNVDISKSQIKAMPDAVSGINYFKRIIGKDLLTESDSCGVKMTRADRAFYSPSVNQINIGRETGIETVAHELGHSLENHNKEFFGKILAYYEKRTRDEKVVRLKALFPKLGYANHEITKPDKFIESYTGKWYANSLGTAQRATEITSMWFTHVFEDLELFIEKDPDHFEFIFKLFNE